jgi:hypothetical protein
VSTTIRKQDVDALASKLEQFAKSLPAQEQGVLGWVLARAQATSEVELAEGELESVAGGHTSGPMHKVLEKAAGLHGAKPLSDSVSWTHTFSEA